MGILSKNNKRTLESPINTGDIYKFNSKYICDKPFLICDKKIFNLVYAADNMIEGGYQESGLQLIFSMN